MTLSRRSLLLALPAALVGKVVAPKPPTMVAGFDPALGRDASVTVWRNGETGNWMVVGDDGSIRSRGVLTRTSYQSYLGRAYGKEGKA